MTYERQLRLAQGLSRAAAAEVPGAPSRPRPADLFSAKPEIPLTQRTRAEIVSDIQRELERRGFYHGPIDGMLGPNTETAIQDFAEAAGLKVSLEASEELLRTIVRSSARGIKSSR